MGNVRPVEAEVIEETKDHYLLRFSFGRNAFVPKSQCKRREDGKFEITPWFWSKLWTIRRPDTVFRNVKTEVDFNGNIQ